MRIPKTNTLAVYEKTLSTSPWSPPGVSLIAARRIWPDTTGENVVVAVLDTGIDYEHPDLAHKVVDGISLVPGEKTYMDGHGHGTHVAGIIAAQGSLLGVAPGAKLLAVRVLDNHGQGSYGNIARGIEWAIKWRGSQGERVNIINMSLGGPIPNSSLHKRILEAINEGITVVCAAGNEGDGTSSEREISYPAYYSETIAVGAVDLQTRIANFSNSNDRIDVVAPGVDTYSTYPGKRYVKLSGTSMATPHIAGSAALIYSRYFKRYNKFPSPEMVSTLLQFLSIDLGDAVFDELYGYGLFSFNPGGGKAIVIKTGDKECQINGKKLSLPVVPTVHDGQMCGSMNVLADILQSDALFIPSGFENNEKDELRIWC